MKWILYGLGAWVAAGVGGMIVSAAKGNGWSLDMVIGGPVTLLNSIKRSGSSSAPAGVPTLVANGPVQALLTLRAGGYSP